MDGANLVDWYCLESRVIIVPFLGGVELKNVSGTDLVPHRGEN